MSPISNLGSVARATGVTALMALASGCYAEADAEPAYVDATVAPVDVDVAPQYYYDGRTVYYVNDHWYARDHGRWVYYRSEPEPLARYRVQVQRAPRAPERTQVIERQRRAPAPRAERREHAPRAERVQ
ncbi:MAG TPA: hypothetical protein VNW92_08040 [Polyangiaceae bacterium]|jgi:hypothetical protein|nr:hypothetical protein [Polyangiaceae bacterium]